MQPNVASIRTGNQINQGTVNDQTVEPNVKYELISSDNHIVPEKGLDGISHLLSSLSLFLIRVGCTMIIMVLRSAILRTKL